MVVVMCVSKQKIDRQVERGVVGTDVVTIVVVVVAAAAAVVFVGGGGGGKEIEVVQAINYFRLHTNGAKS